MRQYGDISCTSSVGLLLWVYDVCVPATASYGCEVWPCWRFPTSVSAQRAVLPKLHLKILKQILGVRKTVHTDIVWKINPIKRLEDIFGQPIIKFWNNLSVAPSTSLYRLITLASCHAAVTRNAHNWAWSFYRGVRACGYMFDIEG